MKPTWRVSTKPRAIHYRGKLTREHVWPERFNKIVKVTGLAEHQRGHGQRPRGDLAGRSLLPDSPRRLRPRQPREARND
jgi:hypothetical protein